MDYTLCEGTTENGGTDYVQICEGKVVLAVSSNMDDAEVIISALRLAAKEHDEKELTLRLEEKIRELEDKLSVSASLIMKEMFSVS